MQTRKPIVAGQFYPAQYDSCLEEINDCIAQRTINEPLPQNIVAGVVPHAGWVFSGSVAALVFSAIKQSHEKVNTFVVFGAAHSYYGPAPAVYGKGSWASPMGEISIDEDLAGDILKTESAVEDEQAHKYEHSIEVQIPFIQFLFASAKILPILTPPDKKAISLGSIVGETIKQQREKKIICIGSTDLTHYGPRYGFTPMGADNDGLKWAHQVNDKEFIDSALKLEPEKILVSAAKNQNACGSGAAAATIAAAKKLGVTQGYLLAHTNSNEIMQQKMGTSSSESVGYAAIVF